MATIHVVYDPHDRLRSTPPAGAEHAYRDIKSIVMKCDDLSARDTANLAAELSFLLLDQIKASEDKTPSVCGTSDAAAHVP